MQKSERSGILFALCGFALLSVGDAVVKTMAGQFSPLGAATLRFIIGAIGVSVLLYRKEGPQAFRPVSYKLQAARGFCLAAASLFFFSAVFVMPLATVMAIAFVAPVIVALLSGPLLGEKVRPAVWLASFAALVGVTLVLRPNLGELGILALLPLGSALFFALMIIANRASAGQGSALSMQVFMQVGALPLLFIAAIGGHLSGAESLRLEMPDWTVLARCALVALTASTAHWLAYIGTQRAGAATIAPTTYVQMLVATFMGWWWFDNVPDLLTLAGAAIIISAGLLLWWSTPREPASPRGN